MKKLLKNLSFVKWSSVIYAAIIIALAFMFFTNDFGLVDIRKTSVIIGMGIDVEEEQVRITAQVAVPQPSENGENTQFTEVTGQGQSVAAALKEINSKTGFYPKLIFCKLIILGESCAESDVFEELDYFYRNEYTQLTPKVAMCKGSAESILGTKMPFGGTATLTIEQVLSDEAKKSGNVATVTLKDIGHSRYAPGGACYMPYLEVENAEEEVSGGEEGQSSASSSGGSKASGGGGESSPEFTGSRTALFNYGKFCGVLDNDKAFALNLLNNQIRHTFVVCEAEGKKYTMGLRSCSGGADLSFKGGKPVVSVGFKATCQIQDAEGDSSPEEIAKNFKVPQEVIDGLNLKLKQKFSALVSELIERDCDALGLKEQLYRKNYSYYDKYKDDLLSAATYEYKVNARSSG